MAERRLKEQRKKEGMELRGRGGMNTGKRKKGLKRDHKKGCCKGRKYVKGENTKLKLLKDVLIGEEVEEERKGFI